MTVTKKEQIVMMMNLCSSIVEGSEHLTNGQSNPHLRQDTIAGLETLNASLNTMCAKPEVIQSTQWLQNLLITGLYEYEKEFLSKLYIWYCQVLKELKTLLVNEILRCPICSGTGIPYYSALIYRDTETESLNPEPVRIWMQCIDCGNFYLAKDKPQRQPSLSKQTAAKQMQNAKTKISRILPVMEEYITGRKVLFVGEKNSFLYQALAEYDYSLHSCTFEELEIANRPETFRQQYQFVIFQNIADAVDIKAVLNKSRDFLENGGAIWFDMKDIKADAKDLTENGYAMWKDSAAEVCIAEAAVEQLAGDCGFRIIHRRHVNKTSRYIEYTIAKELISC